MTEIIIIAITVIAWIGAIVAGVTLMSILFELNTFLKRLNKIDK